MRLFINPSLLKENKKNSNQYIEMLFEMKSDILDFYNNFYDDPKKNSGWGHNYFCEDDGGRLLFNPDEPESHTCKVCGRDYSGEKYNKSWVYFYRYRAFEVVYKSAVLYKINRDKKYLGIVINILLFYAKNYKEFAVHAKDKVNLVENGVTGFGKIMPQGLNEAIMLISLVNSLDIVKCDISEEHKVVLDKFVVDVSEFLFNQRSKYHNIICWMNSAIGCAGVYLGSEKYIHSAVNTKYGLRKQLQKGLTEDSFWYEGSIHYHFFTIEGILNFLLLSEVNGFTFCDLKKFIKSMLLTAYNIAFDNLTFPNPNDGWPNISLKTYSFIYDMAAKVFPDDKEIIDIVNKVRYSNLKRETLPLCEPYYFEDTSLNSLVYPIDISDDKNIKKVGKSKDFRDSGFTILKNDSFNIFMKYANKSQSHAHPDLLNIELTIKDKIISRDLSNPGYGAKLYDEWYKTTVAHNTVVIDGEDQNYSEASTLIKSTKNRVVASVLDAYNNTLLLRDIKILDKRIEDYFMVEMDKKKCVDYVVHLEAQLLSCPDVIEADLKYTDNGYQHFNDIKKIVTKHSEITLDWIKDGVHFSTIINIDGKEMFLCKSYDNPSTSYRNTIILRSSEKKIVKNSMIFTIEKEEK